MSKRTGGAGAKRSAWHTGRPSGPSPSDVTDQLYGVEKPDVVADFFHERLFDGLSDDHDGECPCGSGKSYRDCHGQQTEA